jgi:hypothetical protein
MRSIVLGAVLALLIGASAFAATPPGPPGGGGGAPWPSGFVSPTPNPSRCTVLVGCTPQPFATPTASLVAPTSRVNAILPATDTAP